MINTIDFCHLGGHFLKARSGGWLDMFGTQHYSLFLLGAVILTLTPGQDTLYIVGRSLAQGRRAGLLSVAGIGTGAIIHLLCAAFGLSTLLAASAQAFTIIRITGAAYLAYLGVRMWLDRSGNGAEASPPAPASDGEIYRSGFFTNLLNPKVALFYLAFLPQFVNPAAASKVGAFLFLGLSFYVIGNAWCVCLALGASALGSKLRRHSQAGTWVKRAAGTLFIGLGARLAAGRD